MLRLNENVAHLSDSIGISISSIHSGNGGGGDPFAYFFDGVDDSISRNASDTGILTATAEISMCGWIKLTADGVDTFTSIPLRTLPFVRTHIRKNTNELVVRRDNAGARELRYALGTGNRNSIHFIAYANGTTRQQKLIVNGTEVGNTTQAVGPSSNFVTNSIINGFSSVFSSYYMRDPRIYVGPMSTSDAVSIMNGGEPSSATKYLDRGPLPNESGSSTIDTSGNNRIGTLNGGMGRQFILP